MPRRLRPTAPIAARAVLVGDPGRALLLAQELLEGPKMSNHARGLWGYVGRAADGGELTIQSTGMGGPSAAVVLADLVELGVRAAVRVGTCVAAETGLALGELLLVGEAEGDGTASLPDRELKERLAEELAEVREARIASLHDRSEPPPAGVAAADMQTATVLARAAALGIAAAAVLIVEETAGGGRIADEALETAAKRAGHAAAAALPPPPPNSKPKV